MEPDFEADDIKPLEESMDTEDDLISDDDDDSDDENTNDNADNPSVDKDDKETRTEDNVVPDFFKRSLTKANVKFPKSKSRSKVVNTKEILSEESVKNAVSRSDVVEADSTTDMVETAKDIESDDVSVQISTSDEDTPSEDETVLVKTPPDRQKCKDTAKYKPLVTKYASRSGTFTVMSTENSPPVQTVTKGTVHVSLFRVATFESIQNSLTIYIIFQSLKKKT